MARKPGTETGTNEETTGRWKDLAAMAATGGAIMAGMSANLHQDRNNENSRPVVRSKVIAMIGVEREVVRGTNLVARLSRMA